MAPCRMQVGRRDHPVVPDRITKLRSMRSYRKLLKLRNNLPKNPEPVGISSSGSSDRATIKSVANATIKSIATRAQVILGGLHELDSEAPRRIVAAVFMEVPDLLPDAIHQAAAILLQSDPFRATS